LGSLWLMASVTCGGGIILAEAATIGEGRQSLF
jgi:hypothetical protein